MLPSKKDVAQIIEDFGNQGVVFQSEAQFQFQLAWELKQRCGNTEVLLEYVSMVSSQSNKRFYTDVIVKEGDQFVAIELKYKTKAETINGVSLLEHGATDCGRYDYLWDIKRLQLLKNRNTQNYSYAASLGTCVDAFAVMLTNESKYWEYGRTVKRAENALYYSFCLKHGEPIPNKFLDWAHKQPPSENHWTKSRPGFTLDPIKTTHFAWEKYGSIPRMRYVICEI